MQPETTTTDVVANPPVAAMNATAAFAFAVSFGSPHSPAATWRPRESVTTATKYPTESKSTLFFHFSLVNEYGDAAGK